MTLDQKLIILFKQNITLNPKNITELSKRVGVSRPTSYEYLDYLYKIGYIKNPKLKGKNVIIKLNIEQKQSKFLRETNQNITDHSKLWKKDMLPSFKKPHHKQKKVDLTDTKYRYRLAQINNLIAELLTIQRKIIHVKITSQLKDKNTHGFDSTLNRCISLIKKISKDAISIDKKHKHEILDFFSSNISNTKID